MPKAWLTGLPYRDDRGYYSDPPHWEERMCGDSHWFPRWYHNHIRYGLLHWGPIGWITVSYYRWKRYGWKTPRCPKCRQVMLPWIIPIGLNGRMWCQHCYEERFCGRNS